MLPSSKERSGPADAQINCDYRLISPRVLKTRTAEGRLSIALINRKSPNAKGVPKNLGSKQNRIQKKMMFLFPDLQETTDVSVILELMKIKLSNLHIKVKYKDKHVNNANLKGKLINYKFLFFYKFINYNNESARI